MRHRLLLLTAASAVTLAIPSATLADDTGGCAGATSVPGTASLEQLRDATLCLVNKERTDRDLRPLRSVPALDGVAVGYARRMIRDGFFDHTSPDGGSFVTRIKQTSYLRGGVRRWSVGENLAWGSGTLAAPAAIVKSWMRSPGHRANILSGSFTELGLGVAAGAPRAGIGRDAATYVNEFGLRRR